LELAGVSVYVNAKIEEDSPALAKADAIIIAAGAVPIMPPIKGIENTINVLEAHLDENKLKGDKIVYCGGGLSACDSALETAIKGKKVAVIEMLDEVAAGDHMINKAALIPMLLENNVELYTGHKVLEITAEGVKAMQKDGKEVFIEGNTIVASFGMKPNNETAEAIDARYHNKVRLIGDCTIVGKVGGAVRSGMYAAMSLR
jgi:thioredoxin reductase